MNKSLLEYLELFIKEKRIQKPDVQFLYDDSAIHQSLQTSVTETSLDDFLEKCKENIKSNPKSSTKYKRYDIVVQFYNYLSNIFGEFEIEIERDFGLLFPNIYEKNIYLLKALQNKDLGKSVKELGLGNLLYGPDVIRDDIRTLKSEGFEFCGQVGKLVTNTKSDNCHPIYLTLNSNELFTLMRALSESGNLDGFSGRIMARIYSQLSENAQDFIETQFEERDLDARYLSNDISFKEIEDFKEQSIYAIEICDKNKKKRICVELKNGNKISGKVTYYSFDVFEVNGKEYYMDDVKKAYVMNTLE